MWDPVQDHELYEQGDSLAYDLRNAGLLHGDEAEVILEGVGVKSQERVPHLCFCATSRLTIVPETLVEASAEEHETDIPTAVHFSHRSRSRIINSLRGMHGFATIRARVVTNGSIHLHAVRILHCCQAPIRTKVATDGAHRKFVESIS